MRSVSLLGLMAVIGHLAALWGSIPLHRLWKPVRCYLELLTFHILLAPCQLSGRATSRWPMGFLDEVLGFTFKAVMAKMHVVERLVGCAQPHLTKFANPPMNPALCIPGRRKILIFGKHVHKARSSVPRRLRSTPRAFSALAKLPLDSPSIKKGERARFPPFSRSLPHHDFGSKSEPQTGKQIQHALPHAF